LFYILYVTYFSVASYFGQLRFFKCYSYFYLYAQSDVFCGDITKWFIPNKLTKQQFFCLCLLFEMYF